MNMGKFLLFITLGLGIVLLSSFGLYKLYILYTPKDKSSETLPAFPRTTAMLGVGPKGTYEGNKYSVFASDSKVAEINAIQDNTKFELITLKALVQTSNMDGKIVEVKVNAKKGVFKVNEVLAFSVILCPEDTKLTPDQLKFGTGLSTGCMLVKSNEVKFVGVK